MDGEAKNKSWQGHSQKEKRRQLWDYSVKKKNTCAQYVAMN